MDPNFTLNGKSKSLDDLIPSPSEAAAKKSKNISLLEMGRANTYDDQVIRDSLSKSNSFIFKIKSANQIVKKFRF